MRFTWAAFCDIAMFSERMLNFYGLDCFGGLFVLNLTFWNLFGGKIPVWRCAGPTSAPDHRIIWRIFNSDTRCHYQRAYLLKIQQKVNFCKQAQVLRLSISIRGVVKLSLASPGSAKYEEKNLTFDFLVWVMNNHPKTKFSPTP